MFVSDLAKGLLTYTIEGFKKRWYIGDEQSGMVLALELMANFYQIEAAIDARLFFGW